MTSISSVTWSFAMCFFSVSVLPLSHTDINQDIYSARNIFSTSLTVKFVKKQCMYDARYFSLYVLMIASKFVSYLIISYLVGECSSFSSFFPQDVLSLLLILVISSFSSFLLFLVQNH